MSRIEIQVHELYLQLHKIQLHKNLCLILLY